jgi:hypothetical protein
MSIVLKKEQKRKRRKSKGDCCAHKTPVVGDWLVAAVRSPLTSAGRPDQILMTSAIAAGMDAANKLDKGEESCHMSAKRALTVMKVIQEHAARHASLLVASPFGV